MSGQTTGRWLPPARVSCFARQVLSDDASAYCPVSSGARTGPRGVFWDAFPRRAEYGIRASTNVTLWLPPVADCDYLSPCCRGRVGESILSFLREARNQPVRAPGTPLSCRARRA